MLVDLSGGSSLKPTVLNQPFSGRMTGIHPLYTGQKPLQRGWIGHHPDVMSSRGFLGRVNFLFNPQEVTVDTQITLNGRVVDPAGQTAANGGTDSADPATTMNVAGGNIGSTSINLLFDRTYEINSGAVPAGVYDDVLALYKLLGLVEVKNGNPLSSNSIGMIDKNDAITWSLDPAFYPSQYAGPTMVYVVLGAIRLYGAITDMSVTYTHWSSSLVPMRCAVSLNMALYNNKSRLSRNYSSDAYQTNYFVDGAGGDLGLSAGLSAGSVLPDLS